MQQSKTVAGQPRPYDRHYVAMVTPFDADTLDVDEHALRTLVRSYLTDQLIADGIAIIVNAEAGESLYLSRAEMQKSVAITLEETQGRIPVFAGAIALRTEDIVQTARDARDEGADGIFAMPPIGSADITLNWDSIGYPEVFLDVLSAIDDAVNLPLIVHPTVAPKPKYGVGLPVEPSLLIVSKIDNVVGWKMTYSWEGWRAIGAAFRNMDRHISILGAGAHKFHEALAYDLLDGTATASFCYAQDEMLEHVRAYQRGDTAEALRLWTSGLVQLHSLVYSEPTRLHIRYKLGAWIHGTIPNPVMRPPMPRPRRAEAIALRAAMQAANITTIDDEHFDDGLQKFTS